MSGILLIKEAHGTKYLFAVCTIINASLIFEYFIFNLSYKYGPTCIARLASIPASARAFFRRSPHASTAKPPQSPPKLPQRPENLELDDLEQGCPAAQYPWNPAGETTIGHEYPTRRVLVTSTGLPADWDRPDNTQPIRAALASAQMAGPVRVAAPGLAATTTTLDEARSSSAPESATHACGTQTAMRNHRGLGARERMPGGMAPMRFWWLLLEEQRVRELAREERGNRRWSW